MFLDKNICYDTNIRTASVRRFETKVRTFFNDVNRNSLRIINRTFLKAELCFLFIIVIIVTDKKGYRDNLRLFFLFLNEKCYDPILELSWQDGSNGEYQVFSKSRLIPVKVIPDSPSFLEPYNCHMLSPTNELPLSFN